MIEHRPISSAMPPEKAGLALAAWAAGKDTLDISRMLGIPEAIVANELPKYLERQRSAKNVSGAA